MRVLLTFLFEKPRKQLSTLHRKRKLLRDDGDDYGLVEFFLAYFFNLFSGHLSYY